VGCDQRRLLLDPYILDLPDVPLARPENLRPGDLVLITHSHWDHLAAPALEVAARRGARLVAPAAARPKLDRHLPPDALTVLEPAAVGARATACFGDVEVTGYEPPAEYEIRKVQLPHRVDVRALADELLVRPNFDIDVEIADPPPRSIGVALTGEAQAGSRIDAGRDPHGHRAPHLDPSLPAAPLAGFLDAATRACAGRTRLGDVHEPDSRRAATRSWPTAAAGAGSRTSRRRGWIRWRPGGCRCARAGSIS
jgi:hypothetical protein